MLLARQGYLEPYLDTYYFSADRKSLRFVDERVRDGCTYQDRKTMLEAQHTRKYTRHCSRTTRATTAGTRSDL